MFVVPSDHFILQTDASYVGLSRCLSCQGRSGVACHILQPPVEASGDEIHRVGDTVFSVVESISHFLILLDGRHFTLETDHRALEYLLTARLTNKRLIRWALQLQGLHFVIKHRSGAKNANADGLSRQAWSFAEDELSYQRVGVPVSHFEELSPRMAPVLPVGDVGWLPVTPHIAPGAPDAEH